MVTFQNLLARISLARRLARVIIQTAAPPKPAAIRLIAISGADRPIHLADSPMKSHHSLNMRRIPLAWPSSRSGDAVSVIYSASIALLSTLGDGAGQGEQ